MTAEAMIPDGLANLVRSSIESARSTNAMLRTASPSVYLCSTNIVTDAALPTGGCWLRLRTSRLARPASAEALLP